MTPTEINIGICDCWAIVARAIFVRLQPDFGANCQAFPFVAQRINWDT